MQERDRAHAAGGGGGGGGGDGGGTQRNAREHTWNTLFIGGLPMDWTEQDLRELLLPLGALSYVKFMKDKDTGRGKVRSRGKGCRV